MGLPNEVNSALIGAAAAGGYEIEQSLRFGGGQFIGRANPASTATSTQTFTHSFWVKRGSLGSAQQLAYWVQGGTAQQTYIAFDSSDRINVFYEGSAGASVGHSYSTARYRDPSAWYHIVWATDTTQSTSTNRWKLWVNGEQVTTWDSVNYPSQNLVLPVNHTGRGFAHGTRYGNEDQLLSGYIAESYFVDGQFLDQNDFGKYNNGVWTPIQYSGTYGARGWYLPFDATDIYSDESGNNQDFAARGDSYDHTTSGTGTDVMDDTPTNNFCTLNPISVTSNLPSGYTKRPPFDGNLSVTFGQGQAGVDANFGITPNSGKFYWEVNVDTSGSNQSTTRWGVLLDGSNWDIRNAQDIASVSNGDVLGFAVDANAGTIDYYKNNTLQGTSPYQTFTSGWKLAVPWMGVSGNGARPDSKYTFNFGQRAFAYTPPTGFEALSTANLPAPDIADGTQHVMPVLWTGTGSARTQGGYNFRPDLLWIMNRSNSGMNVRLYDNVRGGNGTVLYRLGTNQSNSEDVDGDVTSLTSTGFTIGNDGSDHPNVSGQSYVGWGWGEGAANGFDIVGYTGNGYPAAGTQNISHNLGVPPKMIIIKNRDRTSDWVVGHHYLGWNGGMEGLNDTNQFYTNSNFFNNTAPTSSVFTVGTDSSTNYNGDDFIAYLFAEIEGFSKGGLYERNGNVDGPFIYTGFRPALLLLKEYNGGAESWAMYDSTRGDINPIDNPLFPNDPLTESYIESTYTNEIDFLSNGFKLRNNDSRYNSTLSSYKYLWWAWAEHPFGGSGVSPATAR